MNQKERKDHIKILVTDLFPRLYKQRILLTQKNIQPTIRSTDGKQYIIIPYNLFEQYLLLGQQYYIENREWTELSNFTNCMLDCCGYTKLSKIGFQSHISKFQYMQEKRLQIRVDPNSENREDLIVSIAFIFELKVVAVEFIQFCYEYYRAVCTLDSTTGEKKSCLIPICAIKPALRNNTSERECFSDATTAIQPENYRSSSGSSIEEEENEEFHINANNKRSRSLSESFSSSEREPDIEINTNKCQKMKFFNRGGGEGLDSYCMNGVDNALQILSKAADCMRHIVSLWNWAFPKCSDGDDWEKGMPIIFY